MRGVTSVLASLLPLPSHLPCRCSSFFFAKAGKHTDNTTTSHSFSSFPVAGAPSLPALVRTGEESSPSPFSFRPAFFRPAFFRPAFSVRLFPCGAFRPAFSSPFPRPKGNQRRTLSPPRKYDVLLPLPVPAILEQLFPRVGVVRTPLALGGSPVLRPLEVLSSEAVSHLQLVEPGGQPFRTAGNRSVRPVPVRHLILPAHDPASQPSDGLWPAAFRDIPLEMREGSGEGHQSPSVPTREA
jgi:hypothetical protein